MRMPDLMVPVINEAFGTDYPPNIKIDRVASELRIGDKKIESDVMFLIKDKRYHIECQSTDDDKMVVRMLEYDLAIALEMPEKTPDGFDIFLPRSCIVYLRGVKPERGETKIRLRLEDEVLGEYTTKTLEVGNYDIDSMFSKNLLAFLPFYVMRYEKLDDEKFCKAFREELSRIYNGLRVVYKNNRSRFVDLCKLIRKVANYVLRNKPKSKESVGEIMGGKVLKLESERLLELGEKRGLEKGEFLAFIKMVDSGLITEDKAAEALGISVTTLHRRAKQLKKAEVEEVTA